MLAVESASLQPQREKVGARIVYMKRDKNL